MPAPNFHSFKLNEFRFRPPTPTHTWDSNIWACTDFTIQVQSDIGPKRDSCSQAETKHLDWLKNASTGIVLLVS